MNDAAHAEAQTSVSVTQGAGLTGGAYLRQAREDAGLHIGALAAALKVPVKKLQALEDDRFDLLPDAVFARALAATICRTLKLDVEHVLRMLPEQNRPRLRVDARLGNAGFDTPGMGWRLPLLSRLSKPVVVSAGLLLLGAAVLLFLPSIERLKAAFAPAVLGASTGAETATVTTTVPVGAPPHAASANQVAAAVAPAAVAATSGDTVAGAPAATPPAEVAPPGAGLLVFKVRGSSWVEVTDAAGVVQLRKTMANGESASASGALPLTVVVGRVDSTDMLVRGKVFDLAAVAKDNVARFQIK